MKSKFEEIKKNFSENYNLSDEVLKFLAHEITSSIRELGGALNRILATAKNFPVFTYTPQFVEIMGTELSKAIISEKSIDDALASMNSELEALAKKDGLYK